MLHLLPHQHTHTPLHAYTLLLYCTIDLVAASIFTLYNSTIYICIFCINIFVHTTNTMIYPRKYDYTCQKKPTPIHPQQKRQQYQPIQVPNPAVLIVSMKT